MSGKPRKRGGGSAASKRKASPAAAAATSTESSSSAAANKHQPEACYLLQCDVPTKQYIQYLNDLKGNEHKRFIIQDLDSTHLLVKLSAKAEIEQKVEDWLDLNVFSAVEKVGEDFDVS